MLAAGATGTAFASVGMVPPPPMGGEPVSVLGWTATQNGVTNFGCTGTGNTTLTATGESVMNVTCEQASAM
jgi:hypothetical protein